jgi:predicted enzyme related to lactoylglutathione lyase
MALLDGEPAAGIGPKPQPMPSVWTTYIAADDVDAAAAKVTAAGGQLLMPPFDVMTVGRMTVFTDPAGAAAGLWQAKDHAGAGVFNQPGAYCWNELHTRDYEAAKAFLADVFGYTYTPMSATGQDEGYVTFAIPGGTEPAGGIADDARMGVPGEVPPHWLTWFAVEDADTAAAAVASLGGRVITGPDDSPVGRMAVVTGPQGETFGIITVAPAS